MDAPVAPTEPPSTPPPPPRRNWLPIAVTAFLLAGVAGMLGFLQLRSTPEAALAKIALALRTHDEKLFLEYVDLDQSVTQVLEALLEHELPEIARRRDETIEEARTHSRENIEEKKPLVTEAIRKFLSGDTTPPADDIAKWVSSVQCDGKLTNVRTDGPSTLGTLRLTDPETEFTFDLVLKFQRHDGHLQIIGVDNALQIIDRYEKEKPVSRGFAKKSPETVEQRDEPKEVYSKFLTFKEVALRRSENGTGELGFEVTIQNTSARTLVGWDFSVRLQDAQGKTLFTVPFHGRHRRLRPYQTLELSSLRALDETEQKKLAVVTSDLTALSTKTAVTYIEYDDGSPNGQPLYLDDDELAAAGPTEEETQVEEETEDDSTVETSDETDDTTGDAEEGEGE